MGNFINDRTRYKVAHGDVQFAYNYALEHEWFEPMRRKYKKNKKIYKEETEEGNEHSDEGVVVDDDDGEFELVKMKKMKKNKKQPKKVVYDVMSDEDLDEILREYAVAYNNEPKNAAQIQAF